MVVLYNGKCDNLEISFNLWVGVGLVCGGVGMVLVGDGFMVVVWINEYVVFGIDSFVFSGYLYLEEVYRVGELLFLFLDVVILEIF